jgi:hypothetical protein
MLQPFLVGTLINSLILVLTLVAVLFFLEGCVGFLVWEYRWSETRHNQRSQGKQDSSFSVSSNPGLNDDLMDYSRTSTIVIETDRVKEPDVEVSWILGHDE